MLDDLDYIARFDSQNSLAIAAGQHHQLDPKAVQVPKLNAKFSNIVLAGMGGSALAGLLVRGWLDDQLRIPFVITRGFELPAFVDSTSLVIVSSYSGNTQETLSALKQAQKAKSTIVVMGSSGQLADIAKKQKLPTIMIPPDYPARLAVWYMLNGLAQLFDEARLIKDTAKELFEVAQFCEQASSEWLPQVKTANNSAKQMAEELMGKAIWVYGGPTLATAAYKWKIDFNENSKNVASWNELPEFDHNEIAGWLAQPLQKPFAVIQLQSSLDGTDIQKRFDLTKKLLSGKMPKPMEVKAQGKTKLQQILHTVLMGDFVSIYLAVLNQVNPVNIEVIEKLKKQLK